MAKKIIETVEKVVIHDTLSYHPQAELIAQRYEQAAEYRKKENGALLKELGIDDKTDITPRPFIYFLPTGNKEFDQGVDYVTPKKDPKGEIKGGGIAVGRFTIISGRSGIGKSGFCYSLCRNAAFRTLYIDTEGGIIDQQAPNVTVYNTEILEQCWRVVMAAIDTGKFNCIVIDSLTNLKTREDMQKEDGEMPRMGQRAQVMNSFLTKLTAKLMSHDVAVIMVSQERESMDLFKKDPVLPGGASLLYGSSMILGLLSNKADEIRSKDTGLKIGQKTRVKVRKNRYGPDNCEFPCKIYFGDEK